MYMNFNPLVPELTVSDLQVSLEFYTRLGFKVEYFRLEQGFVFLSREGAQLMLEQFHPDGWNVAELEKPFGRGINFQIECSEVAALLAALQEIDYPLYRPRYETWRKAGQELIGEAEFLVQDPDGYLLRFSEHLGSHSVD
jgi:catechol 2,3-dioxygenase-like lactoylglutathione lyase family enzyme